MLSRRLLITALFAVTVTLGRANAGIVYVETDLGTLGGSSSIGYGVNGAGVSTGYGRTTADAALHAFLSGPNGSAPLKDLGTLGGLFSFGRAVNSSGQVAGDSQFISGSFNTRAFLSDPNGGALHDLGTLGGVTSTAAAVNDRGQVTGYADLGGSLFHAYLSDPNGGALHDLGTFGGNGSYGQAVNSIGQVAGAADLADGSHHAFLSDPNGGALHDLGTLGGGIQSAAFGLNEFGQVVGNVDLADGSTHAFLSDANGGTLHDLGTLGGFNSTASAINNSGVVVGSADTSTSTVPFVYFGGKMYDLTSLLLPGSAFQFYQASGINDAGQIIGSGVGADGQTHAILLTPVSVPEPSSIVLISAGAFGLLAYSARGRRQVAGVK